MFDVSQIAPVQWAFLMAAAFLQGMSKGGVPGLTVMAIPLVAMVIPGKASTGLVLPMLVVGAYRDTDLPVGSPLATLGGRADRECGEPNRCGAY